VTAGTFLVHWKRLARKEKFDIPFSFPSCPFQNCSLKFCMTLCVCQPSVTDQAVSWNTARGVHILLTNKMKRHDVKLYSGKLYSHYQYLHKQ
jgi:hypothetical protein